MLKSKNKKIEMDKGDYGLPLVMKITNNNGQIINTDTIHFEIIYEDLIVIKKTFQLQNDGNNNLFFTFILTKEESNKLIYENYTYKVGAYRDGIYLNTLINHEAFEVR